MSKGRNARKYARAHVGVFLVTLGIVLYPVAARTGVEGDLELLQRTAMMIRENRDKIRYWQGSATIDINRKDRQGAWLRQEKRSARFWLSRDLDAVRWSMSIDSLKFPDAGGRLVEAQGVLRRTDEMKKGHAFYRLRARSTMSARSVAPGSTNSRAGRGSPRNSFSCTSSPWATPASGPGVTSG